MNFFKIDGENKLASELARCRGLHALFCWCKNRRDLKIDKKVCEHDQVVGVGQTLTFYYDANKFFGKYFDVVFEDENVIVVNKHSGIEVCDSSSHLLGMLCLNRERVFAVHRLDRQTRGLCVFAKNKTAQSALTNAFRSHSQIEKTYIADVEGRLEMSEGTLLVHYHKKDAKNSKVSISDFAKQGFSKIQTIIKSTHFDGKNTRVKVRILTGKTHQIRAVLAHLSHAVLGDGKYGKAKNGDVLHLCAQSLKFNFGAQSPLAYLNEKSFCVDANFNTAT